MKVLYPYLMIIFLCLTTMNSFGQSSFSPATNLNIDLITSSSIEVTWTQGTNVLYYELEFILDGNSTGVLTLPSSASSRTHFDPPNGIDGIVEIEVILTSFGLDDDGNDISADFHAVVTVDEVYQYEDFNILCTDLISGEGKNYSVRDSDQGVHWSVPCICQTVAYIEDDQHVYHEFYPDYASLVYQTNGFVFGHLLGFLNSHNLLHQEECQADIRDEREEGSGKKENNNQVAFENLGKTYIYKNSSSIVITNIPITEQSDLQLFIFDVTGKRLPVNATLENDEISFDKGDLSKGLYFVKIVVNNKILFTDKLQVE